MATVTPTITRINDETARITWVLTNTDADGAPVGKHWADHADRNVQVLGTFGGATVAMQGSNDGGTTYFTLDDPQGTDLSFSAAGGKAVSEVPQLTRPLLTGGAASSVTVAMVLRRSRSAQGV